MKKRLVAIICAIATVAVITVSAAIYVNLSKPDLTKFPMVVGYQDGTIIFPDKNSGEYFSIADETFRIVSGIDKQAQLVEHDDHMKIRVENQKYVQMNFNSSIKLRFDSYNGQELETDRIVIIMSGDSRNVIFIRTAGYDSWSAWGSKYDCNYLEQLVNEAK